LEEAMSIKAKIINKAFAGRADIWQNCIKGSGAPSSAAPVGTLYWDITNENADICTVATGTWVKINA